MIPRFKSLKSPHEILFEPSPRPPDTFSTSIVPEGTSRGNSRTPERTLELPGELPLQKFSKVFIERFLEDLRGKKSYHGIYNKQL